MFNAPCKRNGILCDGRSETCRESCREWAEYRTKVEAMKEAIRKDKKCIHDFWYVRHHNTKKEKLGVKTQYVH